MDPQVAALGNLAALVAAKCPVRPVLGVVLGSGLGALGDQLEHRIPYADLPGMPLSRVPGHAGNLRLGRIEGVQVACLQGRAHLYEGYDAADVVFGVRLLARVGCRAVILTNAAGGIAPWLAPGDRMLLRDHLNLTGRNPLTGPPHDELGSRFVDMGGTARDRGGGVIGPYDARLNELARAAARDRRVTLREGVYAGVLGPSYETPAEIRMLRTLGADAVGMSTVLEVIALRQLGIPVAAISCITNLAAGISPVPLDHREVEAIARRTSGPFVELLGRLIELVGSEVGS
jgi:purine-nucleoside phosphorylase